MYNKMKMRIMIIVVLLCLVIASCASLQATPVAVPTNTPQPISIGTPTSTSIPEATPTSILMPDGLIMISPSHYKFLIWPVSFSLSDNWDINNKLHLSSIGTGREVYIFYRNDIVDTDSKNEYPRITLIFETVLGEVDIKTYSEDTLAKGHGADIVINQTINTKEFGLNLDSAVAYKGSYIFEGVEYTQYIVHVVYQTTGIEIIMDSETESFASFDPDFLFFLKNLSFE